MRRRPGTRDEGLCECASHSGACRRQMIRPHLPSCVRRPSFADARAARARLDRGTPRTVWGEAAVNVGTGRTHEQPTEADAELGRVPRAVNLLRSFIRLVRRR